MSKGRGIEGLRLKMILRALRMNDMTVRELVVRVGSSRSNIANLIRKLVSDGRCKRAGRGVLEITKLGRLSLD